MKTLSAIVISLLITVTQAVASSNGEGGHMSLLAIFFLSFGVLVILFQFVPGLTLFGSMMKGLFSSKESKESLAEGNRKNS